MPRPATAPKPQRSRGAIGWGTTVSTFLTGCFIVLATVHPAQAADLTADLATTVLPIFDQKCGTCHGPHAKKKEKFGYVTDLPQLAANPKLIVPGNSAKSKVWTSIDEGDMPPSDDERSIPLSPVEKEAVKAWIDAGAHPLPIGSAAAQNTGTSAEAATNPSSPQSKSGGPPLMRRLVRLVGKFHPLVAHFPIALLMAAALAEAGWFFTKNVAFTGAVRFCTIFGGLGALGAGALGWVNALSHTSSTLLTTHRWLGTAAGLWAIPLVLLCEGGIRRAGPTDAMSKWSGWSRTSFQLALFAGVTMIGLAAHLGGALVYGEDYFNL